MKSPIPVRFFGLTQKFLILFFGCGCLFYPFDALAQKSDPWSKNSRHPVIFSQNSNQSPLSVSTHSFRNRLSQKTQNLRRHEATSFLQYPLYWSLFVYQKVISPADGARCHLYPTCSAYARQAVVKHGALIGFMMAAERVMRSHGEFEYYPTIQKFGHIYLYDPISSNDFWFSPPEKSQ